MELLQLRYFCDAAKTENFSVTASHFSVPPSAVSQSIRRLEQELGVRLFTRRANTVALNEVGAKIYEKASAALRLLEDITKLPSTQDEQRLHICINVSRRRIFPVLKRFQAAYPAVEIHAKHLADPTAENFDFIIASDDPRLTDYQKERFSSEQLSIAIHKSNPLAAVETLTVDMLKNERFILMNTTSSMHQTALRVCADFGFHPHIALQSDDPQYLTRLVDLNMGVAIVPILYPVLSFSEEVRIIPIAGYTRDTFVYTKKGKRLSLYAEEFIKMLKEEYAE